MIVIPDIKLNIDLQTDIPEKEIIKQTIKTIKRLEKHGNFYPTYLIKNKNDRIICSIIFIPEEDRIIPEKTIDPEKQREIVNKVKELIKSAHTINFITKLPTPIQETEKIKQNILLKTKIHKKILEKKLATLKLLEEKEGEIIEEEKELMTKHVRKFTYANEKMIINDIIKAEFIQKKGILVEIPHHLRVFKVEKIEIKGKLEDNITSSNTKGQGFHPNIGIYACFGDFFGRPIYMAPILANVFKIINLDSAFENEATELATELFQIEYDKGNYTRIWKT
ncbi:MAG TPA: hypothetical protein ENO30_02915 [Thermodesulfobium narugense]|nr:hypothetical protein [Thermodesulfobium narugense]